MSRDIKIVITAIGIIALSYLILWPLASIPEPESPDSPIESPEPRARISPTPSAPVGSEQRAGRQQGALDYCLSTVKDQLVSPSSVQHEVDPSIIWDNDHWFVAGWISAINPHGARLEATYNCWIAPAGDGYRIHKRTEVFD